MRSTDDLLDWLMANGGPSIQLQVKRNFMDNPLTDDFSKLLEKEAFLDISNMKLKRNKQEELIRELVSTLYILKIRKRINDVEK
jgi:hypothetical protein